MTYGDIDIIQFATVSSTLAVTFSSSDPKVATIVNDAVHTVSIGQCFIYATQGGDAEYIEASARRVLRVSKKELTVTGATAHKIYDGTTEAIISGATLVGVVNSDDVALSIETSGTFASADAAAGIAVTTNMEISGTATGNYNLTQPNITADIIAKELTVADAAVENKVYDGTTEAIISGATLVGLVNNDAVNLSNETIGIFVSADAATGIAINTKMELSGTATDNYIFNQPNITADISKATLNVNTNDTERKQNEINPSFVIEYDGFVNDEDSTYLDILPIATCSAEVNCEIGDYPIVIGGGSANNYSFAYTNAILTIVSGIGIDDNRKLENTKIYPNPAYLETTIEIPELEDEATISIYNLSGSLVKQQIVTTPETTIQLNNLQQGVYPVKIQSRDKIAHLKLLVN